MKMIGHSRCQAGQATIEAAVLIPSLMLVSALLAEPLCLGYTFVIMRTAASETARAVCTDYDGSFEDCRAYALRRLKAVPEVSIFHVGGEDDWDITLERADDLGRDVGVAIKGHARPLPLLGVAATAFGQADSEGIVLSVEAHERLRADWISGDYDSWQQIWG